ncbi:hypothetical protein ACFL2R_01545, partial [Patescibacteria group bacterium]
MDKMKYAYLFGGIAIIIFIVAFVLAKTPEKQVVESELSPEDYAFVNLEYPESEDGVIEIKSEVKGETDEGVVDVELKVAETEKEIKETDVIEEVAEEVTQEEAAQEVVEKEEVKEKVKKEEEEEVKKSSSGDIKIKDRLVD